MSFVAIFPIVYNETKVFDGERGKPLQMEQATSNALPSESFQRLLQTAISVQLTLHLFSSWIEFYPMKTPEGMKMEGNIFKDEKSFVLCNHWLYSHRMKRNEKLRQTFGELRPLELYFVFQSQHNYGREAAGCFLVVWLWNKVRSGNEFSSISICL